MTVAVRDSIQPISAHSWLIGDRLLLTRETGHSPGTIPSSSSDISYALKEVRSPPQPRSRSRSAVPSSVPSSSSRPKATTQTDTRSSLAELAQSCEALVMDCSKLSLYHLDLGPGYILLDVDTNMKSVIDFERVGYVPDEWIRTKFRVYSGLDLSYYDYTNEANTDWRAGMQRRLGELGWSEVMMEWMIWQFLEST
jgi:hypothetical protein